MNFAEMPPKINKEALENYHEANFNVEEKLKELKGPLIEAAGPTIRGYELINVNNLDKKIFISNLHDSSRRGKIDFRGDIRKFPIKDNSVGALFVSALGGSQGDSSEEFKRLRIKVMSDKRDARKKEFKKFIELNKIEFRKLVDEAIREAFRVIEDKGLLIWQDGVKEDIVSAENMGFVTKVIQNNLDRRTIKKSHQFLDNTYDLIFEKVLSEAEK
ncbi:MAG: hypothetical protein WC249_00270 [Patescibacteria group bacterium]|jgi:hypothetical protein